MQHFKNIPVKYAQKSFSMESWTLVLISTNEAGSFPTRDRFPLEKELHIANSPQVNYINWTVMVEDV